MMFDSATWAAYVDAGSASARAQAVRDSLGSGTLTVELRDGETLIYSGTFTGPMTAGGDGSLSADVLLSGLVGTAGTPSAATWTCRIRNDDGRWLEGSFGPGGRFTFSAGSLTVGQAVRLGVRIEAARTSPAWFNEMNQAEWLNFPGSTFSASGVGSQIDLGGDTGTFTKIVSAWGGACLNTVGIYAGGVFVAGTWLVLFGGGHGDYYGNELYAFGPLEGDSPGWVRISDPTNPPVLDAPRDINGYPVSRHTYDTLVYLPTINKMICIGAPGYSNAGGVFNSVDLFDFSVDPLTTTPWSSVGDISGGGGGAGQIGAISAYDPGGGKAWSIGRGNGQRLHEFTESNLAYTSYIKDNPIGGEYASGAVHEAGRIFCFVRNDGEIRALDLTNPSSSFYVPTTTGAPPSGGHVSLSWDRVGGRFVAKVGSGKQIWFLTPGEDPRAGGDPWAWTSHTPGGGDTPGVVSAYGYFSRLQVVNASAIRGVIALPNADTPVSFYRI